MGRLVDGKWIDSDTLMRSADGRFVRNESHFRHRIAADGPHPPAKGRYHLYVAQACPWAHRTMIMRALKGLTQVVSASVVKPLMLENGWQIDPEDPGPVPGLTYLHELYTRADAEHSGRVTVPVLWDREANAIVNNESEEIIRMFNSDFGALANQEHDYYPEALREEIHAVNERVYHTVNNGVYRAGFASSQEAYTEAVTELFDSLQWLETRLMGKDYLVGDQLTEADIRLFTTLLRFDLVYHTHFKCNLKHVLDYPNLRGFRRRIYCLPGVAETFEPDDVKLHYFGSHGSVNPHLIVPAGPAVWL